MTIITPLLDIDGDGATERNTDGELILRYFLGVRGADLIDGAVDLIEGTRLTAREIEAYLERIWWQCDVDGDGAVSYQDVVFILRVFIGLAGPILVTGNLLGTARRRDPTEIWTYVSLRRLAPLVLP